MHAPMQDGAEEREAERSDCEIGEAAHLTAAFQVCFRIAGGVGRPHRFLLDGLVVEEPDAQLEVRPVEGFGQRRELALAGDCPPGGLVERNVA